MPKAYVSSTFEDLKEYRGVVSLALRRAGFEDVAMEYYVAEDKRAVDRCLDDVAACDLYVGIFAWRYGWKPLRSKKSITELEYLEAVRLKKPRLLFLADEDAPWPIRLTDANREEIVAFRSRLKKDRVSGMFGSPDSLMGVIAPALMQHANTKLATPKGFDAEEYFAYLRKRYGFVDLETLMDPKRDELQPLRLDTVFVEQNVREDAPPLELPKDAWEILQKREEIHADDLPRGMTAEMLAQLRESYSKKPSTPVLTALAEEGSRLTIVLGDPGSGKSTLLRYLAVASTDRERKLPGALAGRLPILVDLKAYTALRARNECRNFFEYFDCLRREESCPASGGALRDYLEAKRPALALFDGVDEIFDPEEQERITGQITAFANAHPSARIVVTSRIIGYRRALLLQAGFRHYTLQDLGREQVLTFARCWYGLTTAAPSEVEARVKRIETAYDGSASIQQLAGNPMLLTIMAIIGKHQELPRERWNLYEHAASVLVTHWDVKKHLPGNDLMDEEDKKELLRRLAYAMQSGEGGLAGNYIHAAELQTIFEEYLEGRFRGLDPRQRVTTAREMIAQFRTRNFILISYGANLYGFVHRAFLEFFCASAIVRGFEKTQELKLHDLHALFEAHQADEAWHEVLRLICGAIDELVAAELIEMLRSAGTSGTFQLAVQCFSELRRIERADELGYRMFVSIATGHFRPFSTAITHVGKRWPAPARLVGWLKTEGKNVELALHLGRLLGLACNGAPDLQRELIAIARSGDGAWETAFWAFGYGWQESRVSRNAMVEMAISGVNLRVRRLATEALGVFYSNDPECFSTLMTLAADGTIYDHVHLVFACYMPITSRSVPMIVRATRSEAYWAQVAADRLDSAMGDPEVRASLEALLTDEGNGPMAAEILARHPLPPAKPARKGKRRVAAN